MSGFIGKMFTGPADPRQPPAATAPDQPILELINSAARPNPLNPHYQSTYHFRLFMAADGDVVKDAGSKAALFRNIDGQNQITIAESGVTGYNIRDVTIAVMPAGNLVTRDSESQQITVTVTEANGVSFLDALTAGAVILKLKNWQKALYYLELKFLGYDESGQFVSSLDDKFPSGGRWIWSMVGTTINVKLNEGSGVYTLNFQSANSEFLVDQYNVTRIAEPISAKGNTLKELFASYIDNLNIAWFRHYNAQLVHFEAIVTSPVGATFKHPASAADKDPGTFHLKPQEAEKNPNRTWELNQKNGMYTVNVAPGYPVPEFIIDALKQTVEGQALAKDNSNVRTQVDKSSSQVNDNKHRQSITWSIETVVKKKEYDTVTGNYVRNVTFYISPVYTRTTDTRTQAEAAKDSEVQRQIVLTAIENGLFRKKYDYIFTGLNTEVLEFNFDFNINFNSITPIYGGALMSYESHHENALLSSFSMAAGRNRSQDTEDNARFVPADSSGGTASGGAPAATPTPDAAGKLAAGTPNREVGKRIFIEDALTQVAQGRDFLFPPSFWQGNRDVECNAGSTNFLGAIDRDKSAIGAIWTQRNGQSVKEYVNCKLTIRGDPYWLGQSNLHRQMLLQTRQFRVSDSDLPPWSNGPHYLFLTFRYPLMTGDDFKPVMKTSQMFNGVYSVNTVTSHFADGFFKQELTLVRQILSDVQFWTPNNNSVNGGAGSSPQVSSKTPAPPVAPSTSPPGLGNQGGTFAQQAPGVVDRLMKDFNLTRAQASGIVGNLGQESGLQGINEKNPTVPGSAGGFGWAQWTGPRRDDFNTYVAKNGLDPTSPDANYGFLRQELQTTERASLAALRQTGNVNDATAVFQKSYERAGNPQLNKRIAYANQAYDLSAPKT